MANRSQTEVNHASAKAVPSGFGRRMTDRIPAAALLEKAAELVGQSPKSNATGGTMPKVLADTKNAALKAAAKKTGAVKPKHIPKGEAAATDGVDTGGEPVVESEQPTPKGSVFNPETQESIMTKTPETAKADAPATQTKQEVDAAKVKAAMEAKAAKQAEADKKKAEREAAAKAKAEQTAANVKAREEAAQKRADERTAREATLKEGGRTYVGSMLALAERVKAGVYVKSTTGQLRSTDDVAVALDAVPPENVVKLGMLIFGEPNKYSALNIGQQSMNYRNRMRGAIKKGTKIGEQVITLDYIKAVRDKEGLATGEAELAKKAEAKVAREKAAADKKALQAKAAQEAAAKAAETKAAKAATPAAAPAPAPTPATA